MGLHEAAGENPERRLEDDRAPVTILALAEYRLAGMAGVNVEAVRAMAAEGLTGADFERAGLAIMGGCQGCGASIAAYNAYPARSGFWRCADCIGSDGWQTVEACDAYLFPTTERERAGEALERDLAILAVLERLARFGERQSEVAASWARRMVAKGDDFEHESTADELDEEAATAIASQYEGATPGAVLDWVRARITETENTLEDVNGTGMPSPDRERRERVAGDLESIAAELVDWDAGAEKIAGAIRRTAEELRR